jgi:hypothetical protein
MPKLLLLLFVTLSTSYSYGSTASSSRSSTCSSYAGEVLEWADNRDGTSKITVECLPQKQQLVTKDIKNKWLQKTPINDVIKMLDDACKEAYCNEH